MPERLFTTVTGSFPRPAPLAGLLDDEARGVAVDPAKLSHAAADGVRAAVRMQKAAGVDIVGDGEQRYLTFMDGPERCTGYGGRPFPFRPADQAEAPMPAPGQDYLSWAARRVLASNDGPISYRPAAALDRIATFKTVLAERGIPVSAGFLSVPAPGTLARLGTSYYGSDDALLDALAAALAEECKAITDAGLMVQLDDPMLLMGWHTDYHGMPIEDYRKIVARRIQAINDTVAGLEPQMVRLHACRGNYKGTHHRDLPLAAIFDLLCQARAGTVLLPMANGRHAWEHSVFAQFKSALPEQMTFAVGVIDPLTSTAEHEQTVAGQLIRVARVIGPGRVQGTTDCGFATYARLEDQHLTGEAIELKLRALVEGTRAASEQLHR